MSIRVKNKLFKKFLKTKSTNVQNRLKLYKNKLKHLIRLSKKKFYNNYFLTNKNDTKKTWMGIKQIITIKPQCSHSPSKLKNNETEITDATRIANEFNEFFANVGTYLANKISSVDATPADYLPPNLTSNFDIFPTSASEIEEEILNLKSKKASGSFSIPTKTLKLLRDLLCKPLEILYNRSFSSGIVPD